MSKSCMNLFQKEGEILYLDSNLSKTSGPYEDEETCTDECNVIVEMLQIMPAYGINFTTGECSEYWTGYNMEINWDCVSYNYYDADYKTEPSCFTGSTVTHDLETWTWNNDNTIATCYVKQGERPAPPSWPSTLKKHVIWSKGTAYEMSDCYIWDTSGTNNGWYIYECYADTTEPTNDIREDSLYTITANDIGSDVECLFDQYFPNGIKAMTYLLMFDGDENTTPPSTPSEYELYRVHFGYIDSNGDWSSYTTLYVLENPLGSDSTVTCCYNYSVVAAITESTNCYENSINGYPLGNMPWPAIEAIDGLACGG